MNKNSCSKCEHGVRQIAYDYKEFAGYYCRFFRNIVHDYYAECKHFKKKEAQP